MPRARTKAPDHNGPYRAFCEAAGWRFVTGDEIRRLCGEPFGIVHAASFERAQFYAERYSGGIYDTWETCHDDWVAHPDTPQPSTAVN